MALRGNLAKDYYSGTRQQSDARPFQYYGVLAPYNGLPHILPATEPLQKIGVKVALKSDLSLV